MLLDIRRNFGLKVLALFLAIVGWSYFRFAGNSLVAARFDQQLSVPIVPANLPAGYLARFTEHTAVVTIEPQRGQPPVKPEEVKAVLDLANRTAGVYNVPVQLVAPNIAVQSLSPASVTLTVEKIDQRSFPVAMYYDERADVVVTHFTVAPNSVVVRGPTSELARVATVRVTMPLVRGAHELDEMIRPRAVGSAGDEITDVQVVPNLVRVRASFAPGNGAQRSRP